MIELKFDENGKVIHNRDKYTAIKELDRRLTKLGISHEMHELLDGYQICVPEDYEPMYFDGDAIQHHGSYGAEQNLLEVWGFNLPEPDGCLTVDKALEYFIEWDKKQKGGAE